MATKLFVNLPVKDLNRSKAFFTGLGLAFFGQAEDMASVIISEHTQVMLLTDTVFASYARNGVVDATAVPRQSWFSAWKPVTRWTSWPTGPRRRAAAPSARRGTTATVTSAGSPTSTGTTGRRCA
jgi:Predicted lactoylglutathione lyase